MNLDATLFSLARQAPVSLADVRAVVTGDQTEEEFYHNCIGLFPVILGPMSAAEIAGQRNLTGYTVQTNGAEQYNLTHALRTLNKTLLLHENDGYLANYYMCALSPNVEAPLDVAPLLPAWKQWGEQLYGDGSYELQMAEGTRRNADSSGPVIGRPVHQDASFAVAYNYRMFSILSLCGDAALDRYMDDPFWTTEVFDTRPLICEDYRERAKLFLTEDNQRYFLENCGSLNVPANCHILMPSNQLHRVGGKNPPIAYRAAFPYPTPQPKAYVGHAKLERKQDLRF